MAESRKPALTWGRYGAESERLRLSAMPSSDRSGEFYWSAWLKIGDDLERRLGEGYAATLLAAQLAAEDAALAWLSEGASAFGARQLTAEQVALVCRALSYMAADREYCMFTDEFDICDAATTLARELGGAHG